MILNLHACPTSQVSTVRNRCPGPTKSGQDKPRKTRTAEQALPLCSRLTYSLTYCFQVIVGQAHDYELMLGSALCLVHMPMPLPAPALE